MRKTRVCLTAAQKQEVGNLYKTTNHSQSSLGRLFNVRPSTIGDILRGLGYATKPDWVRYRKYNLNEAYFDTLDAEKAYFLGLLYADGYNSNVGIKLTLKAQDAAILSKFAEKIGSNSPIKTISPPKAGQSSYCSLELNSKRLCARLAELGVVRAKSLILTFPDWLPVELYSSFIRGYVDGDGHVGKTTLHIAGTKQFCQRLAAIFKEQLGIVGCVGQSHPDRQSNTFNLQVGGRLQFRRLAIWLYGNSDLHIERKYKAALAVMVTPDVDLRYGKRSQAVSDHRAGAPTPARI